MITGRTVKTRRIDVTPDISLIEKIGDVDFTVPEAISELIANSMDARTDGKRAHVKVLMDEGQIAVIDDCSGMSAETLEKALRLAFPMQSILKRPGNLKSHFGLGLKTACASLGRKWCVETTESGSDQVFRVEFDLEKMVKQGGSDWTIDMEILAKPYQVFSKRSDSGTIVTVSRLKKRNIIMEAVVDRLALSYAPHIMEGDEISVNGKVLKSTIPPLMEGTKRNVDVKIGERRVKGWVGLMVKSSSGKGLFGMHLYRNGQLVSAYDKDFVGNHPNFSKVIGELHLNHLQTNYNKKGFNKGLQDYVDAVAVLKAELKPEVKKSEAYFKRDKKKVNETEQIEVEDAVNQIGAQAGRVDVTGPETVETISGEQESIREITSDAIKIGSFTFYYNVHIEDFGDDTQIRDFFYDPPNKELTIIINEGCHLYLETKDRRLLVQFCVADSIAEFLAKEQRMTFEQALDWRDQVLLARTDSEEDDA